MEGPQNETVCKGITEERGKNISASLKINFCFKSMDRRGYSSN